MLSLHTNAASLSTQNSLGSTNRNLTSSMTKLGTGYRVNSAMDDAAGLQIATRLNAQSRGMQVAQKNAQNGISMLQTAEGALSEVNNMVLRMKDRATESATATASDDDREAMQAEFDALSEEITNILENTTFGGQTLLSGGVLSADVTFQIGASSGETYALSAASTSYSGMADAVDGLTGNISGQTDANTMIKTLEDTSAAVGKLRSDLGAAANRLEHTYNNLGNMVQNTKTAAGRIMDVDYAAETANMTKNQMLMQASTSMLKQSSSMSQMVTSLLQ